MQGSVHQGTTHKIVLALLFTACLILLTFSYYDSGKLLAYSDVTPTNVTDFSLVTLLSDNFLVDNPKCKMVALEPFNKDAKRFFKPQSYKSCRSKELLTYVSRNESGAFLEVDSDVVGSYASGGNVTCCYSDVTRKVKEKSPDNNIAISDCKPFSSQTKLSTDVVIVKCKNGGNQVYENAHVSLNINEEVRKKMNATRENATKPVSLLFVGIDSISRLNFIRALPKTHKYVEDNKWDTLLGYNKMDDNTFPNLMAILTGYNQSYAYAQCNPKVVGPLDKCPMLWYDYRNFGYITGYGEDEASISTFNYKKKGFVKPPADFYFRTYVMATEKLKKTNKDGMTYCTGPESAGERIMNLAKDFAVTFKKYPYFGFFWMNSFSHNSLNSPTGMDDKVKQFLVDLENADVYNNSIVIFLSDHGMRFGAIRLTETGWLEERLPFIYFSFPPWFKENFPAEIANFKNNLNRLTTPYDVHMTLQHLLVLSGFNYTIKPSNACPKCKSLFEEIDYVRSCEDAGIEQHWCTCTGYTQVTLEPRSLNLVTDFVLNEIHNITSNYTHNNDTCAKYTLKNVLATSTSQKKPYSNSTYILIKLETNPKAVFEATLIVSDDISKGKFVPSGEISRLDYYSDHSHCVDDVHLKKYCYCR